MYLLITPVFQEKKDDAGRTQFLKNTINSEIENYEYPNFFVLIIFNDISIW